MTIEHVSMNDVMEDNDNRISNDRRIRMGFEKHKDEIKKEFNDPGCVLDALADMYRDRGKRYQESYKQVGEIMAVLYPDGKKATTAQHFNEWHLLMMITVKLIRFVNDELGHNDSIEDAGVYCAMLRSITAEHHVGTGKEEEVYDYDEEKAIDKAANKGTRLYPEKSHVVL